MFGMGHWEILIIFVVILLIFGAKRIPEMAQGLGKGIREFRTAMRDVQDEIDVNPPASSPPPQAPSQTRHLPDRRAISPKPRGRKTASQVQSHIPALQRRQTQGP